MQKDRAVWSLAFEDRLRGPCFYCLLYDEMNHIKI